MSQYGAKLAKDTEAGSTARQRDRDRKEKMITGLAQAALVGGAALYGHVDSHNTRMKQQATAALARMKADKERAPDFDESRMLNQGQVPIAAYGNNGGPSQTMYKDMMDRAVKAGAKTALSKQDANDAAVDAPIGNYMTGPGMERAVKDSSLMGQDINTARGMMRTQPQEGTFSVTKEDPEEEMQRVNRFGVGTASY